MMRSDSPGLGARVSAVNFGCNLGALAVALFNLRWRTDFFARPIEECTKRTTQQFQNSGSKISLRNIIELPHCESLKTNL